MYNVLVAVKTKTGNFAVTMRAVDQTRKTEAWKRNLISRGYDVLTYATRLDRDEATAIRDGHKLMYSEIGYQQTKV